MEQKIISIFLVGLLLATSGCLGLTTHEAPYATVSDDVLQDTSYSLTNQTSQSYNQSIEVKGVSQNFQITNRETEYQKPNMADGGQIPPSTYGILSTPSVSVFGTELNPIVVDPTERAKQRVSNQSFGSVEIGEKVEDINTTHEPTGRNITIESYKGRIIVEEVSALYNARIYTTVIETNNSVVVGFAAYPVGATNVDNNTIGNVTEEELVVELMRHTTTEEKVE